MGSCLRLIDSVYHSAPGLRVIKKKKRLGFVFKAHRLLYHSALGLRVIKKKKKVGGWG